jgi:hypothetical protein
MISDDERSGERGGQAVIPKLYVLSSGTKNNLMTLSTNCRFFGKYSVKNVVFPYSASNTKIWEISLVSPYFWKFICSPNEETLE